MNTDALDVTFTTEPAMDTDQSNNDSSSSMQAWLHTQLDDYVKLNLLEPNEEPDWQNGRVLVCLAHRLFPDRVPDLPTLLLLGGEGDNSNTRYATEILHEELGVPVPSPLHNKSLLDYLDDVRKRAAPAPALVCDTSDSIPTTTCHPTSARPVLVIPETVIQLNVTGRQEDDAFERRAALVMARMTHLREQLSNMVSMVVADVVETPTGTVASSNNDVDLISQVEQFEANLATFESEDWTAYGAYVQSMPADIKEGRSTVLVGARRLQEIDAAYAALESHLQSEFTAIRMRANFSQCTLPLRNELEFIRAKMLKISATTAEASILDLEERIRGAGELVRCIEHDHGDTLLADGGRGGSGSDDSGVRQRQQEFDILKHQYKLTETWVHEVRVWFDKAASARTWIQARIERIESQPLQDGLHPVDLAAASSAFPAASQLHATHKELESEVARFNEQDAACLRKHIQALTGSEKELSPADKTVIEIIPATLMLLDRLILLLQQQAYDLRVITLRLSWEQECINANHWIADTNEQVAMLVKEARWEVEEEKRVGHSEADERKQVLAKQLHHIEKQASEFDQGQFATAVSTYQELNDLAKTELPTHLKARQIVMEEGFEAVTMVISYARLVVEQRLVVADFVYGAADLLAKGEALTADMRAAELSAVAEDSDRAFTERVRLFQEQSVRLTTGVTARLGYPEHPHLVNEESQKANTTVRCVIDEYTSALIQLGATLHIRLTAYQQVLRLHKVAVQLRRDLNQLERSVQKQLSDVTHAKVDVLSERIALEKSDVQRLQTECDNRLAKIVSIKNVDAKTLLDSMEALKRDVAAANAEGVVPVASLEDIMTKVQRMLASLESNAGLEQRQIDGLQKRLAWESHYHKASNTVSLGTRDVWTLIEKIQWRPGTPEAMQSDDMKAELRTLQQLAGGLVQTRHELADVFAEMIKQLEITLDGGSTVPSHFHQRQQKLQIGLNELDESLVFAQAVLDQHTGIAAYMGKASTFQGSGEQLLGRIEEALQKVMSTHTSTSFIKAIERYGREIADLWADLGRQIVYPCRTAGATAARLSTSDDNINIKIKVAVSSQRDKLKYLHEKMQLYNTLYTVALQFKVIILRYVMDANEQVKRMDVLTKAITSDRQNLAVDKLDLSTLVDPNALDERNKTHVAAVDRGHTSWVNLQSQCVKLVDAIRCAGCDSYVQTTMADEAVARLKDRVNDVSSVSARHMRELAVYRDRVDWERHFQSTMETVISIQDKLYRLREKLRQQEALCMSDRVDGQQMPVLRTELDRIRQAIAELTTQVSSMVDPAFERMQTSYCGLLDAIPPVLVDRQKDLHDMLEKLLVDVEEQQNTLDLLAERIRSAKYMEALAHATQRTVEIQDAIENTLTKDLADDRIAVWNEELRALDLEHMRPLQTSAMTDDERSGYEQLATSHQGLVDSLENAKIRLSDHRLGEAYESQGSLLLLFLQNLDESLQSIRDELDTIVGAPDHDQSVCESSRKKHTEIGHVMQERMAEYVDVCSLFDTLQQRQISTDGHAARHMELEKAEHQVHQTLASVEHAINLAFQWKDLHVGLCAIESELDVVDDMSCEKAEEALTAVSARLSDTHVASEKLSMDSSQQRNENAFQKHYDQVATAAEAVKEQVEIRKLEIKRQHDLKELAQALERIEEKAREETSRINEQMDETASQLKKGIDDNQVIQLEHQYEAYMADLTASKVEVHGTLTEELECLSRQSVELGCDQQLVAKSQEALDTLQTVIDDEEDLVALLQRAICHGKDAQGLLVRIDRCEAEVQNTPLMTWDKESNLVEFEDKMLQLEESMDRFRTTTKGLLEDDAGADSADALGCLKKHVIAVCACKAEEAWDGLRDAVAELKDKTSRREQVLNRMQEVLKLCSETHERVSNLENGSKQLIASLPSRPLPDMLREKDALLLEQELGMIEAAFGDHVTGEVEKLDDQLAELEDDGAFTEQRIEIDDAIANLFSLMEGKRDRLSDALDAARCLDIADGIELSLVALKEAAAKADDQSKQTHRVTSELDARCRHHKEKIAQGLKDAQLAANVIVNDTNRQLVLAHLSDLDQRWQQARAQLMGEPTGLEARTRKSSLPTRKSSPSRLPVVAAPSVQSNTSSPLASMSRLLPSSSSSSQRTGRHQQKRMMAPALRRTPSKSASNAETPTTIAPPVNNYVADPKSDLDMEIGRIVNEIAYKVTVKRVPGESGRYWFGDSTPKIAFCRVLKSKMVMVRVGGGWMELTQFLRTHALFDGDYSAPRPASGGANRPDLRFQECFIETKKHRTREHSFPGSL